MGRLAARLHVVAVPGVGCLTPTPAGYAGAGSSWAEHVLASAEAQIARLHGVGDPLPQDLARAVLDRFAAGRAALDAAHAGPTGSSLVHGDFRLENVLLTRGRDGAVRVSAVLDFEMAIAGDGAHDLAWLHYQDGQGPAGLAPILRGYGADPGDPALRERLVLHQLGYALGHLWWLASFDDRPGVARITGRIQELLGSTSS
jgi:aminoglycoside phosphotransferase (APT) family kinase protein